MKTSLDHLPEEKRRLLADITALYRASRAADLLILFGSHARGDWVEDRSTGYRSDFDLLVVVADDGTANDDALWSSLQKHAQALAKNRKVSVIVHDITDINHQLRDGQYFFVDIAKEGVLLYNSGRFRLSQPSEPNPQRRFELAVMNFREWFGNAGHFWRGMNSYFFIREVRTGMFMLHQSAERVYHASLLVFTAYKPRTHDLVDLANKTEPLHPRLADAFPRETKADEDLLTLLSRAYVDARYAIDYEVTFEQMSILRDRVYVLFQRVWEAAREKIEQLAEGREVGLLPDVPRFDDMEGLPPMPKNIPADVTGWAADFVAHGNAQMRLREEEGRKLGRQEGIEVGRREGEARGVAIGEARGIAEGRRQAQAAGIVDILTNRGISLTDEARSRILTCRDDAELTRLQQRVWRVARVDELWDRERSDP